MLLTFGFRTSRGRCWQLPPFVRFYPHTSTPCCLTFLPTITRVYNWRHTTHTASVTFTRVCLFWTGGCTVCRTNTLHKTPGFGRWTFGCRTARFWLLRFLANHAVHTFHPGLAGPSQLVTCPQHYPIPPSHTHTCCSPTGFHFGICLTACTFWWVQHFVHTVCWTTYCAAHFRHTHL